jgi:hypothetical protein
VSPAAVYWRRPARMAIGLAGFGAAHDLSAADLHPTVDDGSFDACAGPDDCVVKDHRLVDFGAGLDDHARR